MWPWDAYYNLAGRALQIHGTTRRLCSHPIFAPNSMCLALIFH